MSESLRRTVFKLPISLCLSLMPTGVVAWFIFQGEVLGEAILKTALDVLLPLVLLNDPIRIDA